MSAVVAAQIVGCATVVAIDVIPERVELASEPGATHTTDANETGNVVEEVPGDHRRRCRLHPGDDCGAQGIRGAVDSLAPVGVCGLIGAAPLGIEVSPGMNDLPIPGKTVRGIAEGDPVPDVFVVRLVDLYEGDASRSTASSDTILWRDQPGRGGRRGRQRPQAVLRVEQT